jgi:hypothetical protein
MSIVRPKVTMSLGEQVDKYCLASDALSIVFALGLCSWRDSTIPPELSEEDRGTAFEIWA